MPLVMLLERQIPLALLFLWQEPFSLAFLLLSLLIFPHTHTN
jgi:hypothetical protein